MAASAHVSTETDARTERGRSGLFLSGLLVLFLGVAGGLIHLGVTAQNALAVRNSETVVARTLAGMERELAANALDYAWWDEGIENTVENPDPLWAEENIGAWTHDTYSVNGTAVFGPTGGAALYAAVDSVAQPVRLSAFGGTLTPLLEETRSSDMAESVPVSGYALFRNGVVMAGAAAMTHEYPTEAQLRRQPRPVLVFFRRLDQPALAALAERLDIADGIALVRTDLGEPVPASANANLPIASADGSPLGLLAWRAPTPGDAMLERAILPAVLALLGALGLGLMIFRSVARTSAELEAVNARLVAAEREARQAELDARSANAAKTRFLSSVSQELRSPLQAMVGFASLIRDHDPDESDPRDLRGYAGSIHAEGMVLSEMIDDLLEFARLDRAGEAEDEYAVDLGYILGMVRDGFSAAFESKGVTLSVETPQHAVRIRGDERSLRRMLRHLVDNALKFTPTDGSVSIALERHAETGETAVSVRDTGSGMDDSFRERATAAFEKAEMGLSRVHGGIGIGLSLVRLIARRHDARMEIESFAGIGTTVSVTFPARRTVPE
jgi:signal transduction histidine kinase